MKAIAYIVFMTMSNLLAYSCCLNNVDVWVRHGAKLFLNELIGLCSLPSSVAAFRWAIKNPPSLTTCGFLGFFARL